MALLPLLFDRDPFTSRLARSSNRFFEPEEMIYSLVVPAVNSLQKQLEDQLPQDTSITVDKDHFQASVDVQQFKPEEITVKLKDNTVTIEGKHEERQDEHGYISRHFVRKYTLPKDCDLKHLRSRLSSDGVLTILAPKKQEEKHLDYQEIPIVQTGKPAKSVKRLQHNSPTNDKVKKKMRKNQIM